MKYSGEEVAPRVIEVVKEFFEVTTLVEQETLLSALVKQKPIDFEGLASKLTEVLGLSVPIDTEKLKNYKLITVFDLFCFSFGVIHDLPKPVEVLPAT